MRTALEEARTGASEGGLPIGAALVDAHGRLVVTGSNCRVQDQGTPVIDDNCPAGASRPFHKRGVWNRAKRLSFPC